MFIGQFLVANFKSFCRRMWLDNCDENKTPHGNPLSYEDYVNRYWIWLLDQYSKQVEKENEPTK
jgi:hypothetical protein